VLAVTVALLSVLQTPATAASRTLFQSDSLELRARLTSTRLVLVHTNLTDFPLHFRCDIEVDGEHYRTRKSLWPHGVWRDRPRTDASNLRGATATCKVVVRDRTVFWKGEMLLVLGNGFIQDSGEPVTVLTFFNISSATLSYGCTWDWDDPPTSGSSHNGNLSPDHADSQSAFGTDISTVANFNCTEERTGSNARS
jgi:hypothetical protein